MVFDPSFGSFGDFLSIASLIKDIALIQQLGILTEAIEHVEKFYEGQRYIGGVNETPVTALETAVAKIWQRLEDFNLKLRKYAASLSAGGSGNALKDSARKIQFKVEEKYVERFQRDILGYNMLLKLLLEVTQMHMTQQNHDETIKHISAVDAHTKAMLDGQTRALQGSWSQFGKTVLDKLYHVSKLGTTLQEATGQILSVVLTISKDISYTHSLVMRLERPPSDPHFVLEDAMGNSHPIYMKTITTWDTFEYVLQQIFVGKRGARRVLRRRYVLQDPSTKVLLDRSWDWEDLFMRRQRVYMRLFCMETKSVASAEKLSSCPWCQTVSSNGTGEEAQCKTCNRTHTRIIDTEDGHGPGVATLSPQQFGHSSQGLATIRDASRSKGLLRHAKSGNAYRRNCDDTESESDEEDVRAFDRIILNSQKTGSDVLRTPLKIWQASDEDAERYNLPPGYSLKYGEPTEDPITLLGFVFDANSLGKWIYDWTVRYYRPLRTAAQTAGELWLLLIELLDNIKRSENALPRIHTVDEVEMIEDFIQAGERLKGKLEKHLELCEAAVLRAREEDEDQLGRNSGVEFVKTIFGWNRELETTKRLMQSISPWNLRVNANCEEVLRKVSPTATPTRATVTARSYISKGISHYMIVVRTSRERRDAGKAIDGGSGKFGENSDDI